MVKTTVFFEILLEQVSRDVVITNVDFTRPNRCVGYALARGFSASFLKAQHNLRFKRSFSGVKKL